MAVLGLRFCARAFSSCGKWGPLFIAMRGPLTIAASLVAEHRLQMCRLSNCGSRAQLLRGMWDLPRPGLEPVCPALAGRFSTTVPPGKPRVADLYINLTPATTWRVDWVGPEWMWRGGEPFGFLLATPMTMVPSPGFGCLLPSSRRHCYCFPLELHLPRGCWTTFQLLSTETKTSDPSLCSK